MKLETKICGINSTAALDAAVRHGARYVGFVFYPPSPRALTAGQATALAARVPPEVLKVGLFVDPDDALLAQVLGELPLDLLQLHGAETPRRIAQIRGRFERPIMKAVKVAGPEDLAEVEGLEGVVDRILFDAKAPKHMAGALPGGNAISFDWRILEGRRWGRPWMLSGGLDAGNLAEAVGITGATAVDVSSGVEDRPGLKNPDKIADFLERAKTL